MKINRQETIKNSSPKKEPISQLGHQINQEKDAGRNGYFVTSRYDRIQKWFFVGEEGPLKGEKEENIKS